MAKFDMAQFLADAGVQIDTEKREQIEYIDIDLLVPDPENFYELSGIDELAENISLLGLRQPLRVRPIAGEQEKYMITSGHRRYSAIKKLIAEDGREDLRAVKCIADDLDCNPLLQKLALIYDNADNRKISSADQAKQAEEVEKLLYELKEQGFEFPGRMRDHVARICNISTGKYARLKVIESGLATQFLNLWKSGQLNDAVAYVLAGQSEDRQRSVFFAQTKIYTEPFRCTGDQVTRIFDTMDKLEKDCASTACTAELVPYCDHIETRLYHAAGLGLYDYMDCHGCCKLCPFLKTCKFSCEWAECEKTEQKEEAKAQKKKEAEEKREKEKPEKDLLATSYGRVSQLRKERNVSAEDFVKTSLGYACDRDVKRLNAIEDGKSPSLQDRMPGGIWAHEAKALIATADLLGCSIDYLLGRTDTPALAAAPSAEPDKCVNIDTWQKGNPPKPGWYICCICIDGVDKPQYMRRWFSGKTWKKDDIETVTHWVPVVEEFE